MEELFVLQDARSLPDGFVLFWGRDNRGYTTNLDSAQRYTRTDLDKMQLRATDVPRKLNDMLSVAALHVHHGALK